MFNNDLFPLPALALMAGDDVAEFYLKGVVIRVVFDGLVNLALGAEVRIFRDQLLVQGIDLCACEVQALQS